LKQESKQEEQQDYINEEQNETPLNIEEEEDEGQVD